MVKNLSGIIGYLILIPLLSPVIPLSARPASTCPAEIEVLADRLLKDLPGYANRVIQRSRRQGVDLYITIAGRPEFTPLPLTEGATEYPALFPDNTKQIFFTTLERQFTGNRSTTLQAYYWLFLTESPEGWRMVTIYSQLAALAPNPPLAPRETSNGPVGQAVRLWLRDCRAGALRD